DLGDRDVVGGGLDVVAGLVEDLDHREVGVERVGVLDVGDGADRVGRGHVPGHAQRAGGGLEVHARGPRVVGGGGARVAVGPCAEVPVDVAVLVQHPRGELGGGARSVGAHHRADGGGRQGPPGGVGGDRGVVPAGDAAGEDLGDHLPGQPPFGDLGVADPGVVHVGAAPRDDGRV